MMDVSKLQVGQVYTYKQLCELTGEEYKKGTSKKCQLEGMGEHGFHRFFNFHKISHGKYAIDDIYDIPLDVVDNRDRGNKNIYVTYIELLLMQYLSKKGESYIELFSKKDLWLMLGMINDKYAKIGNDELNEKNKLFTNFEINTFYMRCNTKLESILSSALNNLMRRCLIDWDLVTIICVNNGRKKEYIDATESDLKEILVAKRDMLIKLGCSSLYQAFKQKKQDIFFKGLYELLHERMGWNYYFVRYRIIFDAKHICDAIPETEIKLNRILLNQKVIEYLNSEAQKQFDKSLKRYNDDISKAITIKEQQEAKKKWKLPKNYVLAQKLLTDELIRIEENDGSYFLSDKDDEYILDDYNIFNLSPDDFLNNVHDEKKDEQSDIMKELLSCFNEEIL